MNTEVATVKQNVPAVSNETAAVLSMIERVATDPNSDISKLEKMLEMQIKILKRQARDAFNNDLAEMQDELPRVIKTAKAHNSKYAKLEDINDQIRPVLQKHGFSVRFKIDQSEKLIKVTTILSHRQGHHEETEILLPADTSGSKNEVQAVGSTISYGKRYGICAILNISTGDDTDGNLPADDGPDISDWIAKLDECATLDDLKDAYTEAFKAVTHNGARKKLNAAKDLKKRELSNG